MSATIFAIATNLQAVKPRSRLAVNQILIRLGQLFAGGTFNSRRASDVLGLDFLYTAKVLCRMRKNNLLVAAREPRTWGGYENQYQISTHGFRKINYLLVKHGISPKIPTNPKQPPDLISQTYTAQYLLNGTGTVRELFDHGLVKIATNGVHMPPITDEVGSLLCSFNSTFTPIEMFRETIKQLPGASYAMVVFRASRLQELGYVPKEINPLFFVGNAMLRGCTESVILLDLVLRGCIQLKAENEARQAGSVEQSLFGQTGSLKCQSCLDYRIMLIEEKCKFRMLEFEHDLLKDRCLELQQKLGAASLKAIHDDFSHKEQLRYMSGRIDRNMDFIVQISKAVNRFPKAGSSVIPMKSFINDAFLIMTYRNYTALDYWLER